jgi:[acyl-carrier-protein] S-malonyltransferase
MGKDLWDTYPAVKDLFKTADSVVSYNLEELVFEGSESDLRATDKQQPAITVVNCAVTVALAENGIESAGTAGFSLGEYSALWNAGILDTADLFRIVDIRGRFMEEASRNLEKDGEETAMAAVIGLGTEEIMGIVDSLKEKDVYAANFNSPIQTVLSGRTGGIDAAEKLCDEAGAMRFVRLKVSGPFHTPIMKEAAENFEEELSKYTFNSPQKKVYSNVSGTQIQNGDEARRLCVAQIISPVQWLREEEEILNDGYDRYLETGPGTVLSGLWKSFHKKERCIPLGTIEKMNAFLSPTT